MSQEATPDASPPTPGWWKRRSKKSKFFLVALALTVALIAIVSASGGSSDTSGTAADGAAVTEPDATGTTAKAAPIVHGSWNSDCNEFIGDLSACEAVHVSKVTCQWQDDNVHMSARFRNSFGAHVTVHMAPIYNLLNAGLHGNGLTSVKSVGLDAGEVRTVTVDENPAGVDTQPQITTCRPGVDTLQGVELG